MAYVTPADVWGRVHVLSRDDLQWPFTSAPHFTLPVRDKRAHSHAVEVDPHPCYPHDRQLVVELAGEVEALFPMGFAPSYFLLPHEQTARTNGHANRNFIYNDETPCPYEPYMVLSGKRIPIHPAMTRYLVSHEYGHLVQYWIEYRRKIRDESITQFEREYAELRDVDASEGYGGGRWHSNIGELIANDFRICVTGIEPEFWPHPGFTHPCRLPKIHDFWQEQVEAYAYKPEVATVEASAA